MAANASPALRALLRANVTFGWARAARQQRLKSTMVARHVTRTDRVAPVAPVSVATTSSHVTPGAVPVPVPVPVNDTGVVLPPPAKRAPTPVRSDRRTAQVAEFITGTTFEDLSPLVRQRTSDVIIDTIGVTVAGSRHPEMRTLANYFAAQGAREECSVLGRTIRTSADHAAFLNGCSGHILDFDDTWHPATHTAATMLPALLATAERHGASGADVMTAFAVGQEVQGRLLLAAQNPNIPHLFHPPGTVGAMGCAAAVCKLLDLPQEATQSALGVAASRAAGLMGNVGSTTKCSHSGHAARMGMESACLSAAGFTGAVDMLDHEEGFPSAFASAWDPTVFDTIGAPFHVERQNVALKRYPSHLATHWAITAALKAREGVAEALGTSDRKTIQSRIARVHVQGPVRSYIYRPNPQTTHDTKFSLEYTTCAALLDGDVGIDTFSREAMDDGAQQALLRKVEVLQDPEIPPSFEGMHVRVTVTLDDGRQFSERADTWRGHWSNPQSQAELEDKFRKCVAPSLAGTEDAAARLDGFVGAVRNLGAVGNVADVLPLIHPTSDALH